jgi:hypothetical protein
MLDGLRNFLGIKDSDLPLKSDKYREIPKKIQKYWVKKDTLGIFENEHSISNSEYIKFKNRYDIRIIHRYDPDSRLHKFVIYGKKGDVFKQIALKYADTIHERKYLLYLETKKDDLFRMLDLAVREENVLWLQIIPKRRRESII